MRPYATSVWGLTRLVYEGRIELVYAGVWGLKLLVYAALSY